LSVIYKCELEVLDSSDQRVSNVIILSSKNVSENATANTLIGQLTMRDDQSQAPISFHLDRVQDAPFDIKGNSLLVVAGHKLDYEKADIAKINVQARNLKSGRIVWQKFELDITDVNEAPGDICLPGAVLEEGIAPGAVIGILRIEDPDTPSTIGQCRDHALPRQRTSDKYSCSASQESISINGTLEVVNVNRIYRLDFYGFDKK
jgi:hypothetical protein